MIQYLNYAYTLVFGVIPEEVKPIIVHNSNYCKAKGVDFKLISFTVEPGECACGKSDYIRQRNAATLPRILYVDWDCKIIKFPEFDPQIPMLGKVDYNSNGIHFQVDQWAIYNGDRLDIFNELLEKSTMKKGECAYNYKLMNSDEFVNRFGRITEFEHKMFSTGRNYRP
jgi:hypothetical protein